jgi:RNA polymerase sigma-70 factor (ECF subfamily)
MKRKGTERRATVPEPGSLTGNTMTGSSGSDPFADLSAVSDADLITLVTRGDQDALEVLYERYSRAVYSFSLRIVGDAQVAEEILQEVFVRAWQQGGSFQAARGSLITWLLSITHNLSIDEVRRRKRRPQKAEAEEPETILASLPDEGSDVEEEVWLSSLRVSIQEALQQLPAAQREAIELAYFQGLTQREIAEVLGEPLGTIKTRMRLGMLKLREQLGPMVSEQAEPNEVKLS